MKRFLSFIMIIVLLLCVFSACSKPQGADLSASNDEINSNTSSDTVLSDEVKEKDSDKSSGENDDDGEASSSVEKNYIREGSYIYFGEYPQTLKASSVTVGTDTDSRGYFLGSDGAYYAKVTAAPYEGGYEFSNTSAVTSGTVYYFKVEPIKWRILSESNGMALIACESIIASGQYDDASNNYADSGIRAWLNDSFYKTAFADAQKASIKATAVDNSIASTGHASNANICADTNDNVFLLSYKDVSNSSYGFSSNELRIRKLSDYARASGAWMSKSDWNGQYGGGLWILRSPADSGSVFVRECHYNGEITDGGNNVSGEYFGIVPALTLKLN